jgi:leucyl/phenylalanyl-tRNA---protein transferase
MLKRRAARPIPWLDRDDPFPPVGLARDDLGGVLAAGANLSPRRLLDAYARGVFPWYSQGDPILWWSPDPRMVLPLDELHISHSLARRMRTAGFEMRINSAFREVIQHCAQPRPGHGGTWILPEMIEAYVRLHDIGHAISSETWLNGRLVGGLYGVLIGRMFFGESMFTRVPDASKAALVFLAGRLRLAGVPMIDCQQQTRHLATLGARPIARQVFCEAVADLVAHPTNVDLIVGRIV